jgi:hypothetical protein
VHDARRGLAAAPVLIVGPESEPRDTAPAQYGHWALHCSVVSGILCRRWGFAGATRILRRGRARAGRPGLVRFLTYARKSRRVGVSHVQRFNRPWRCSRH